jgi:hypothetical protein
LLDCDHGGAIAETSAAVCEQVAPQLLQKITRLAVRPTADPSRQRVVTSRRISSADLRLPMRS